MAGRVSGAEQSSDVGRRVAQRREQLGLSRDVVAERAGIAPEYLRYLEEQAASPSIPSLTRVARALNTTVAELSGVAPANGGGAAPRPPRNEPAELSLTECHDLLASHSVGRVAVTTAAGPAIIPVNYVFARDDNAVVFRTEPDSTPAAAEGEVVAFEVDRLDEELRVGWSVVVAGQARRVTDPAEVERLTAQARTEAWEQQGSWEQQLAGETQRWLWVRVAAERVFGSRVTLS